MCRALCLQHILFPDFSTGMIDYESTAARHVAAAVLAGNRHQKKMALARALQAQHRAQAELAAADAAATAAFAAHRAALAVWQDADDRKQASEASEAREHLQQVLKQKDAATERCLVARADLEAQEGAIALLQEQLRENWWSTDL